MAVVSIHAVTGREVDVPVVFQAVKFTLDQGGFTNLLASGVVITGGTTQLEGMPELAEQILGLPVRRGAPTGVGGLLDVVRSPAYATGVGLVKYGAAKLRAMPQMAPLQVEQSQVVATGGANWGARIGAWFKEVF